MGKFRTNSASKEVPAVSTASLPDIIFMLLFFFMSVTSMREVTTIVDIKLPEATELTALEKKHLTSFIYVGKPKETFQSQRGSETQIQLDDAFADIPLVETYVIEKRSAMSEVDQGRLTVALRVDKETKMGIITDIKQALRRAYALRINYVAVHKTNTY
jgi:biopolymer transport protein ExbD